MSINFPNSPIVGQTYEFNGVRYTWQADGYWAILTPGTIGLATGTEVTAGTDNAKYVTSKAMKDSHFWSEITNKTALKINYDDSADSLGATVQAAINNLYDKLNADITAANDKINNDINALANELVPVGSLLLHGASAAPAGTLKCNGAAVNRTTYADLFAVIGTTYGVGNGSTTFNLPDFRGEFARGWDDGRGVDTGRAMGTAQGEETKAHKHLSPVYGNSGQAIANNYGTIAREITNSQELAGNSPDGGEVQPYTSSVGGDETRPRNVSVLYCIKY